MRKCIISPDDILGKNVTLFSFRLKKTMMVRIKKGALTPKFHVGETVCVRSKEKILQSLDAFNKRAGCLFMNQMWDFCGKEFKVLKVVINLFDEYRFKMYKARSPLYILNNVICNGVLEDFNQRCDRSCYLLWHEDWFMEKK